MSQPEITSFSPPFYLAHHISVCALDGGLIVLDLKQRRYFSLSGQCKQTLLQAVAGRQAAGSASSAASKPDTHSTTLLKQLEDRGILTRQPALGHSIDRPHIQIRDSIDFGWGAERPPPLRIRQFLAFSIALLRARLLLRFKPFHSVVSRTRQRSSRQRHASAPPSLDHVKHLVIQFRRIRTLAYTNHEACLFDSMVLIEFLALFSIYPTWVFGVSSRPFRAHTWVQFDGCVLNGTIENVEPYTPILAV